MSNKLSFEIQGNTAVLTLNIPETRNALSGTDIFEAFEEAADIINGNIEIRAAVLTGGGKPSVRAVTSKK